MHIILLILKILGIVLLSVLGILLLLLLVVLFVPVRYRVNARKADDIFARITVKWMFPLLFIKLLYENETLLYAVHIFGIKIYPRVKKEKQKKKKKPRKKKPQKREPGTGEPELTIAQVGPQKDDDAAVFPEERPLLNKNADKDNRADPYGSEDPDKEPEKVDFKGETDRQTQHKGNGFISKIKDIIAKGKNFLANISLLLDFIKAEDNKNGIREILYSLKRILKHLAPVKIKGDILFGTKDPCTTGQILGAVGIFYAMYGNQLSIVPDFERACIEGEIFIKGRIRVFTLLLICIKLLFNKNFKQLRANFEKMKEVL